MSSTTYMEEGGQPYEAMSTTKTPVELAIERAMARIGCPPGDNSDADLYHELSAALSSLKSMEPRLTVEAKWETAEDIADDPGVHSALSAFSHDSTGDNGTGVVLAVLEALTQSAKS